MRSSHYLVLACACAVFGPTRLKTLAQESILPKSNGTGISSSAEAFAQARQQRAAEIDQLIEQLGARRFDDRESASEKLTEFGDLARKALERAVENPDPEIAARARTILAGILPATHTIVDALGAPIPGAMVTIQIVHRANNEVAVKRMLKAESDGAGRIPILLSLSGPPSRDSTVIEIVHPEYGSGRYELVGRGRGENELRFPLVRAGSDARGRAVEGTVVEIDGRPVAGASVRCQSVRTPGLGLINPNEPVGEALTNEAGRFVYYLPNKDTRKERGELIPVNSTYQLTIAFDGDESYFPVVGTYSNLAPSSITLRRAKDFHRFQFEAAEGGWITDPKQLAYLSVQFEGDPSSKQLRMPLERSAVTEGRMLINGKYSAEGFFSGSMVKYDTIDVTDNSPETLQFHLPSAKVFRGRVVQGITGQPLAGAYVMAYASTGRNNLALLSSEDWQKLPEIAAKPNVNSSTSGPLREMYGVMALVRCDEQGTFEITQPPDKKFYGLIALAENFVPFNVRILSLKTDVPGPVTCGDFSLFPAAKIIVRPVHAGARLAVSPKWLLNEADQPAWIDRFRQATDRQNREFEYVHWLALNEAQPLFVPAGIKLRVKFETPYDDAWAPELKGPIQLQPGESHELGDVQFAPSLPAIVRVVDQSGRPLEGIPVRRRYDDGVGSVAHNTDAAGKANFFVHPSSRGRFYIYDFPSPGEQAKAENLFVKFDVSETAPEQPFQITLTDQQKQLLLEKPQRVPNAPR